LLDPHLGSAIFMRRALVAVVGPPRSATLALAEVGRQRCS
jgi:hypothetical protein